MNTDDFVRFKLEATRHATELEQWSLLVDSDPLKRAMTDAAVFLRSVPQSQLQPTMTSDSDRWLKRLHRTAP